MKLGKIKVQNLVNQNNLKPHKINKLNNCIGGFYIDKKVCKNLITYFNKSNKIDGLLNLTDGKAGVDKSKKLSTDVIIQPNCNDKPISNYLSELSKVVDEYKKQYKYCDIQQDAWGIAESWNIQRYKPKEGYFINHAEKSGFNTITRHLVFMTYLNDVSDGGETEFYYQKIKVKPETGLTLIWGSDWTFTHKGITSPTQTKYIATGWYNYLN